VEAGDRFAVWAVKRQMHLRRRVALCNP
jgi:hypothetical protein